MDLLEYVFNVFKINVKKQILQLGKFKELVLIHID